MNDLFSRVVGHMTTQSRFKKILASKKIPHTFLFVGPEGQGKKMCARAFAQVLLCQAKTQSGQACGECPSCRGVERDSHIGLVIIEPEKGVIKIETVRQLLRQIALTNLGPARIVIINDAQSLNPQATNALLKSIEEPPPNTYFIFISPSQNSVLSTLRSRAQIIRFTGLTREQINTLQLQVVDSEGAEKAVELLTAALQLKNQEAIELCRDRVDGREQALLMTRYWLKHVRDQWHEPTMGLRPQQLARVSEIILAVERDIQGHCDIQLTFENGLNEISGVV